MLLHVCCGPCGTLPLFVFSNAGAEAPAFGFCNSGNVTLPLLVFSNAGAEAPAFGFRNSGNVTLPLFVFNNADVGAPTLEFLDGSGAGQRYIEVTGLFYNPNIHPADEFNLRLDGAEKLFELAGRPLIVNRGNKQRDWEDFENANIGAAPDERKRRRCEMCYRERLSFTTRMAREAGFDAFSTTLLISPYQQHETIASICEEQASLNKIDFIYWDGRPLFREGQKMAREIGLYRQKYCGCIFSAQESYAKPMPATQKFNR